MPDLADWATATPDCAGDRLRGRQPDLRPARRQREPARPCLAQPRARGGRRGRAPGAQHPCVRRDGRRLPAQRPPPHARELAPHRRRGRLHRRRLRGQGARHDGRLSPRWPRAASSDAPGVQRRAQPPTEPPVGSRRTTRRSPPSRIGPSSRRTPGTTMLYTSGTTGRPKGVHRLAEPRGHHGQPRRVPRSGRRRAPVHRTALPRCTAGVLAHGPAHLRGDRRADGRVGRAGDAVARSRRTA